MQTKLELEIVRGSALISQCQQYRFSLERIWDINKPYVMFVMLNPSTADSYRDDPTIRRCINFANSWGYGGMWIGNLFPLRATNPIDLQRHMEPIKEKNIAILKNISKVCNEVVCAWGNSHVIRSLSEDYPLYKPLSGIAIEKFRYIDLCADRTPKHPLYLNGSLQLKEFDELTIKQVELWRKN